MIIEDDSVRIITLGDKDTYVSQLVNKDGESQSILFSNKPPSKENNTISYNKNDVLIVSTNLKGVLSYLKAGFEFLKTHNLESGDVQIQEICKVLEKYLNEK